MCFQQSLKSLVCISTNFDSMPSSDSSEELETFLPQYGRYLGNKHFGLLLAINKFTWYILHFNLVLAVVDSPAYAYGCLKILFFSFPHHSDDQPSSLVSPCIFFLFSSFFFVRFSKNLFTPLYLSHTLFSWSRRKLPYRDERPHCSFWLVSLTLSVPELPAPVLCMFSFSPCISLPYVNCRFEFYSIPNEDYYIGFFLN